MTRRTDTMAPAYFEGLYAADPDPWRFQTSDYERAKYAATLGALSRPRYAHALEIGCSIGVLTRDLAARCDAVLAIDASVRAIDAARTVCAACPTATFEARMVPAAFPPGRFDLILLSEVLYFLSADDLVRTAALCAEALTPDGEIVLCHWLGETDYPLTGRDATDLFVARMRGRLPVHEVIAEATYRLDRLRSA
jgi:SAM-dependent methyltransferase